MFKICRHQLRMACGSPRFFIALFMGCAIHIAGILPLFEYAAGIGRPLCILEGSVYFCCERYTMSAAFLAGMAFLSGNAYGGNFWSEPFYYLAQGMNAGGYSAYFPYPHILLLAPLQAVLIGFALNVAYGFVMSLILFCCNLKLPGNLGYAATMLLQYWIM